MDVVSVTSPVGFWRAFLKPKVGRAGCRHLGSVSLPDNRKWAKKQDMGAAEVPGYWNHAHLVGNQVDTPLIMQNFKA